MSQLTQNRPETIRERVDLAPFTSWQVGGPADYLALPTLVEELTAAVRWAHAANLQIHVLGGGSNVLISDLGLRGLTVVLKNMNAVQVRASERVEIEALAGASKSELLRVFLKHKLAPALMMAGLPGDVGGGIVMNAGVSEELLPREFSEITDWIDVLKTDGSIQRFVKKDIAWQYRHSSGWQPGIILRAQVSWPNEPDEQVLTRVRELNRVRLQKQPLDLPSCGSVFKNPPGHKAAQLIDQCGLKGFQIGDAQVSRKHANFVVNIGKARASDLAHVIAHVQQVVEEKTGVRLQTEVVFMGEEIR